MRATLIGSAGPVAGREYTLDAPVVTIGRRDENDIVIKDPTISRKHAEIRQAGGGLILVDKGSTSGTLVNGAPVSGEQPLRDGDIVTIGNNAAFAVQIHPDDRPTVAFSREDLPGLATAPRASASEPPASPRAGGDHLFPAADRNETVAAASAYQDAGRTNIIPPFEPPREQREQGGTPPPPQQAQPAWQPRNEPAGFGAPPTPPPPETAQRHEPPTADPWAASQPAQSWNAPPPPDAGGWGAPPDAAQFEGQGQALNRPTVF